MEISGFSGIHKSFESRVALNPGLCGMRDVTSANKTESAVFIFWLLYFQRIPLSDYLEITTSVVVSCGGPKKSLCISIKCCYIYIFWFFGTVGFIKV